MLELTQGRRRVFSQHIPQGQGATFMIMLCRCTMNLTIEEVTALNTLGIDATSFGLPPQGIVVWQVDELHVYAIGARWIKLLALFARGTYST